MTDALGSVTEQDLLEQTRMYYIKVKYESTLSNKKFIIYTENERFERSNKGRFGFCLIKGGKEFITSQEILVDEIKALKIIVSETQETICTIYPKLFFKSKEYFEYNKKMYKIPNFWRNELPELEIKFSKRALAGLSCWNKKGFFVQFNNSTEKLLALALTAYFEDGAQSD